MALHALRLQSDHWQITLSRPHRHTRESPDPAPTSILLIMSSTSLPRTLGQLRNSEFTADRVSRSVKDELRDNLIVRLRKIAGTGESLFPGIVGYDDTVVPQVVNALLSRHNFILLGLRGQAKSRLLRALTTLLDPQVPYVAGSELRDNPYAPLSKFSRDLIAEKGDDTPIAWMDPQSRYVEKLATPGVTVADLICDVDPIKAARSGHQLGSELTIHYGLLPAPTAASSPSTSFPTSPAKSRSRSSTSCRKATCRLRATRSASNSMWRSSSPPTPKTTRRVEKSSRHSRTASAPKSARTIPSRSTKPSPSPSRKPGPRAATRLKTTPSRPSKSRTTSARSSSRSPSSPAKKRRSTSAAASRSACPSARWSSSSPTPNAGL